MGCFSSKQSQKENPVEIELKKAALEQKLKFKILLLGSGESGKSTVLKAVKLIHRIKLTPAEIRDVTNSLRSNSVQCMQILIEQARNFNLEFENEDFKSKAQSVQEIDLGKIGEQFTETLSKTIEDLWGCGAIKQTWARRKEFWILEAAEYYFGNIQRFAEDDFEPNEEDTIMARVMTTGIITTEVTVPPFSYQVVDVGGQRTERRKWMHVFDDVDMIVYVVNLAGYNTVLYEDQQQNRMKECLALFKQTANNPIFATTPITVVFNKKDLFETKIREDPITACEDFKDYSGTGAVQDALAFINRRFREQVTSGTSDRIKTHFIAARFKKDVKVVWDELVADLKQRRKGDIEYALKALGISGTGKATNPPQNVDTPPAQAQPAITQPKEQPTATIEPKAQPAAATQANKQPEPAPQSKEQPEPAQQSKEQPEPAPQSKEQPAAASESQSEKAVSSESAPEASPAPEAQQEKPQPETQPQAEAASEQQD